MKLDSEQADKMLDEILEKIRQILGVKAKEYVRNEDRMHNFNVASEMTGMSREEVIAAFRLKHEVSIRDLRKDVKEGKIVSQELLEEKYLDAINYYILELMSITQTNQNN